MADAGGIRAGKAFVEAGFNTNPLTKGFAIASKAVEGFSKKVNSLFANLGPTIGDAGDALKGLGTKLVGLGSIAAAPLGLAVKAFSSFEDAMASLRANAKPTAEELEKVNAAVTTISKETGVGPAKVAAAMTELLKAGLPLQKVLEGATMTAIQFAKVAEMDVSEAAVILTDAMNVFGGSAADTADAISRAADASSIGVRDVAMSFSMVSAVAGKTGQSIQDVANAIAILGQNGVKGSDAGTSLKTMLIRLMAPADEGAKALASLGVNVRQANGEMKPMRGIIDELQKKLGGLNAEARDEAMKDIFGTDAIRAGLILMSAGTAGWDEFNQKMSEGLPTAKKFEILMDTLSGFGEKAMAAFERLGVEVGKVLAPAIGQTTKVMTDFVDALTTTVAKNPQIVQQFAKIVTGAIGLGAALVTAGSALSGVGEAIGFISTPLGAVTTAIGAGAGAWLGFTDGGKKAIAELGPLLSSMGQTASQTFAGITDALKGGNLAAAGKVLWAGLKVEFLKGSEYVMMQWDRIKAAFDATMKSLGFEVEKVFVDASALAQTIWANLCDGMLDGFAALGPKLGAVLIRAFTPLGDVFAALGVDFEKIASKAMTVGGVGETAADRKKRKEDLGKKVGDIERIRQADVLDITDRQTAAAEQQRANAAGSNYTPEQVKRHQAVKDAQAELDKAVAEAAAGVPGESNMQSLGGPVAPAKKVEAPTSEDFAAGVSAAAKKVDVKGTFNAAALGRLGAGDSVSSKLEKQIEESKKQTRELEKLNDKARQAGYKFGA